MKKKQIFSRTIFSHVLNPHLVDSHSFATYDHFVMRDSWFEKGNFLNSRFLANSGEILSSALKEKEMRSLSMKLCIGRLLWG